MKTHQPVTDMRGIFGCFGYGSLINAATHRTDIVHMMPARLAGIRRCWVSMPSGPESAHAILSVCEDPNSVCEGVIMLDHLRNLAAVDLRERSYLRMQLDRAALVAEAEIHADVALYMYRANQPSPPPDGKGVPILRSYLDAVMQGIDGLYGETGVRRFVAQTDNWDVGILDDRAAPLYPRSVSLAAEQKKLFDRILDENGIGG